MKPIVIIDAGHGGTDPGASANGIIEKDITLKITKYQYKRFKELGVDVELTRSEDTTLEPNARAAKVKTSGATYCISNHINAGGGDGAEFIHSIYSKGILENKMAEAIKAAGQNLRSKPIYSKKNSKGQDYYYMHRQTGAVQTTIVEYAFLDSKLDDVQQINTQVEQFAEAIIKAFCEHIGHAYATPKKEELTVVLKKGMKGELVKALQSLLIIRGYKITADGDFGPVTEKALKDFQTKRRLVVDGIAGPITWTELSKADAAATTTTTKKPGSYTKIRKYDSDIHIYHTSETQKLTIDIGKPGRESLSNIIKNSKETVYAATNGGFFDMVAKGGIEHYGSMGRDGLHYQNPNPQFIDLVIHPDNTAEVKYIDGNQECAKLQAEKATYLGTSYALVIDGKINLANANKFDHSAGRHPRTMIGQKADKTWILVVADGRRVGQKGLNAKEQAQVMLDLGCVNAVNMDGGGSSVMIFGKQVMNKPSDGKERAIGSAILVIDKE